MLRILFIGGVCAALAAGCGQPAAQVPPDAAPPPVAPADVKVEQPAPAAKVAEVNERAKAQSAEPTAPPSTPVRDLAARLLESDGDGGWRTNEKAATELEKLGSEGIAQLWPLLADSAADVRRGAAFHLLGQFNPAEREQIAAMSALLADDDRTARGIGLAAVKQMRPADQTAAVPKLAKMLVPDRESKAANRAAIARLIGTLKQDGAAGLPALLKTAAGDPDASVRSASLMAISQVATSDQAVPPLVKGLADKDSSPRLVAAARLRQLGPAAAPAANELAAALSDGEARVAEAAAEALINIGTAKPEVRPEVDLKTGTAKVTVNTGQPAVDALAGQLTASNVNARRLALACLAKIGSPASSAASAIEKCKQDPDSQVRQLAEAALRRITGK